MLYYNYINTIVILFMNYKNILDDYFIGIYVHETSWIIFITMLTGFFRIGTVCANFLPLMQMDFLNNKHALLCVVKFLS